MNARSDSLFKKLTEVQRDQLLLFVHSKVGGDVYKAGAKMVNEDFGVACSRTAVCDFYNRYAFQWRLDRAKAAAAMTANSETYEVETATLIRQKLFEAVADVHCDPKLLIMVRSLEIETEKVKLAERRVAVTEAKIEKAHAKLQELLNPENDAEARAAILSEVDSIMGIKSK